MSPTARSMAFLRERGYLVEVCEKWNSFTKTRKDLFGIGDLIALAADHTLLCQTTTASNQLARYKKAIGLETVRVWLSSPARRLVLHGWKKVGNRWKVNEREVTLTDLEDSQSTKATGLPAGSEQENA